MKKLEQLLAERIGKSAIQKIAARAESESEFREQLWKCAHSENNRVAVNALWVMTHLPENCSEWLRSLREPLTDMLLATDNVAKKRNILCLLRQQDYSADEIRGDLLDYCLTKIAAECEPYAIRASGIHLAFKMSCHYPELLSELELLLGVLSQHPLSPGLKSAVRQTKTKIQRLKKSPL